MSSASSDGHGEKLENNRCRKLCKLANTAGARMAGKLITYVVIGSILISNGGNDWIGTDMKFSDLQTE